MHADASVYVVTLLQNHNNNQRLALKFKGAGYRKLIKNASFCCAVYFSLLSL